MRVRRRDEMNRAPHRPRQDDLPILERLLHRCQRGFGGAQPHRPDGLVVVLRLHRAEPPHYLGRSDEPAADDALVMEAALYEIHARKDKAPLRHHESGPCDVWGV